MTPHQLQLLRRRSATALVIVLLLLNLARIGFIYLRGWEKGPPLTLPASETVVRVAARRGDTGPWSELSPEDGRELIRFLSYNWKFVRTRPVCIIGPLPPHFEVRVEEPGGRFITLGLGEQCCAITAASCSPVGGAPTSQVLMDDSESCYRVDDSAYPRAFAILSAALPPTGDAK